LSDASHVQLQVYNLLGQEVQTILNSTQMPGEYEAQWNPTTMPSGMYFYRLVTKQLSGGELIEVRKMLYSK